MSSLDLWPIGNCQVSALIDAEAGFAWACQPRVDGDPLFCSLLEPKTATGSWRIALENQLSAEPRYLKNTPTWSPASPTATAARRRLVSGRARSSGRCTGRRLRAHRRPIAAPPAQGPLDPPPIGRAAGQNAPAAPPCRFGEAAALAPHHRRAGAPSARRPPLPDREVAAFLPRAGRALRRQCRARARRDAARDRRSLAPLGARPRHPARMAGPGDPRRDHPEAVPA